MTVNASSTVSLQCPALGNPVPTISWLQNGLPFSPSPRLQVLEDGRVLQVRTSPVTQSCWSGDQGADGICARRGSLPESVSEPLGLSSAHQIILCEELAGSPGPHGVPAEDTYVCHI